MKRDHLTTVSSACLEAAAGFHVCARRTHDESVAVAARRESESLQLATEMIAQRAESRGRRAPRANRAKSPRSSRKRTCNLRWEWLASTAMVVDGRSDVRLLIEIARVLEQLL